MTKFFITGGEGFIGHHLTKELLQNENNEVIVYDALKHFVPLTKSDWCYYQDYRVKTLNNERITRVRGELACRGALRITLEKYKPNIVIHLASLPIADISNTFPEEATNDIFLSTVNLLDVTKGLSYKIDRFVYVSSSMVYGDFSKDTDGKIIPMKEDQICQPKCIYGSMKLCSEIMVRTYNKRFDIPYVIVRPSAVYGPTDSNKRVTEIFVMNALLGKELILDNGGQHQLDFTYVKDIVQGLTLASTSDKALGETFNITRGEGRKIKDLAEIVIGLNPDTGCTMKIKQADVYRPNRGSLDISKAKRLLGYEPKYSLEDGMREYVEFVKNTILKERYLLKLNCP